MRFVLAFVVLLLVFLSSSFGFQNQNSPFGVYPGDATWKEQLVHLDNLAHYLLVNKDMTGFIVYYDDSRIPKSSIVKRVKKATLYLHKRFKIASSRLKICYGGSNDPSEVIIKPTKTGAPGPC